MLTLRQLCRTASSKIEACSLTIRPKSYTSDELQPKVVLSKDGRTVVCWHPEKPFPYECSLPLPEKIVKEDTSVLKIQCTTSLKQLYRPKTEELERQELMALTHTTKHIWFPCRREFKRRKFEESRPHL